ncbi:hypothetical protein FA13DRAFT_1755487 [Coprinellus micaceus]|uniref:O-methyltransferase C-terminal domain-containing protein n=1 Tax=Coprinellus micaceus TaxID=71717 RepID=A0A4Y7T822_COPMI|nr:hypothetical protein FA13DRAFT_1755487 [Coprinellus micaceus]
MTFAVLRSLYAIIGEALEDIEQVYQSHSQGPADAVAVDGDRDRELSTRDSSPRPNVKPSPSSTSFSNTRRSSLIRHKSSLSSGSFSASCIKAYASPPPSPCVTNIEQRFENNMTTKTPTPAPPTTGSSTRNGSVAGGASLVDFPSLDATFDPASPSETLTSHPKVMAAINRIIGACGQMTATVQTPFLTICDSVMGYHLPACMRIVEAAHVAEIIKEHGSPGLHVDRISQLCGIDASKLAHILRLLATHHIFQELSPDVFALNRISQLREYRGVGRPELKYQGTNGIAAFVGLWFPTLTPFAFAFGAIDHKVDYFGWLEGEDTKQSDLMLTGFSTELGHGSDYPSAVGLPDPQPQPIRARMAQRDILDCAPTAFSGINRFRLERFGKAMSGTGSWEAPGGVLSGFDWASLPRGSIIVDVGGGIGSTSMLLAAAFSPPNEDLGLKFIVQDREPVTAMGEKAWREKYPEHLENGTASFQVHDFFTPQPVKDAAVFLLRVVLHDWPDDYARRVLVHLREAASPETKLFLADFVLPLACADDISLESGLEGVQGARREMAPKPLLPNLGKASANGYWMDLTMNVMFNSQERTLREIVALALSAGWKVIKLTQPPGSLFGYIVAHRRANAVSNAQWTSGWDDAGNGDGMDDEVVVRRPLSRCGTPTFGSKPEPPSVADALVKFGGGVRRVRGPGAIGRGLDGRRRSISTTSSTPSFSPSPSTSSSSLLASPLKPAASIVIAKQRSFNNDAPSRSTLASHGVLGTHHAAASDIRPTRSPSPINLQIANGPRLPPPPAPPRSIRRPSSLANMRSRTTSLQQSDAPFIPPLPALSSLHCSSVSGAAVCSTKVEKPMEGAAAVPKRVIGEKRRSGGSGVANFMRGAGQKLGGMLRFERQDGNEAAKEKIEKLERKLDAYLTDSERTRGRGGQANGRGLALS